MKWIELTFVESTKKNDSIVMDGLKLSHRYKEWKLIPPKEKKRRRAKRVASK